MVILVDLNGLNVRSNDYDEFLKMNSAIKTLEITANW